MANPLASEVCSKTKLSKIVTTSTGLCVRSAIGRANHWLNHWREREHRNEQRHKLLKKLVAEAVVIEPVSTVEFPANREKYRDFR
jgi:hypothetical protein